MTKIPLADGTCFIHVTPDNDKFGHHLDDWCLCEPKVEKIMDGGQFLGMIWSHHAWDRREEWEKLAKQPLL